MYGIGGYRGDGYQPSPPNAGRGPLPAPSALRGDIRGESGGLTHLQAFMYHRDEPLMLHPSSPMQRRCANVGVLEPQPADTVRS